MSQWQRQTVAALRDQVEAMSVRDVTTTRDGFDREFEALRSLDREVRQNHDEFYSAMLGSNSTKNRFTDVLPNEGTRVSLLPINSRGDGDYINANYIDARRLFGLPFVYIATQAPMRNTVFDFWRMIFEHNSRFIVMLCSEIEAGKIKSERYWPQSVGASFRVGAFTVTLINENIYEDSIFRVVRLQHDDGSDARDVYHLQHTSWPDMSVPRTTNAIHDIIAALGQHPESAQFPIAVHCSGGVGRTGVFIAMHIALGLFEKEFPISIPGVISLLKRCRSGMVDRKDQFHFTYFGTLREMQRMISRKARAIRSEPRDANRATSRAMPFGFSATDTQQNAGNNVGPRKSTFQPQHPAQMTPLIATTRGVEPVQMEYDENRHLQFNSGASNPYMRQQQQGSQSGSISRGGGYGGNNYNNNNNFANTTYRPGASSAVDDQLNQLRQQNRAKRVDNQQSSVTTTTLMGRRGGGSDDDQGSNSNAAAAAIPMQQPLSPVGGNSIKSPQPRQPAGGGGSKFDNL